PPALRLRPPPAAVPDGTAPAARRRRGRPRGRLPFRRRDEAGAPPRPAGRRPMSGRWRAKLAGDRSGLSAAAGGTTSGRRPMTEAVANPQAGGTGVPAGREPILE